jgi:hypothetical protein
VEPDQYRNPQTGTCESFGSGGGGNVGCGDYGGPDHADEADPFTTDWGLCNTDCEAMDEDTCLASDHCRGIYTPGCAVAADAPCDMPDMPGDPVFQACWSKAQSGPFEDTRCSDYGADECSRHVECIAVHNFDASTGLGDVGFIRCDDEPAPVDPGSCSEPVSCDEGPPDCPVDTIPGRRDGCWTGFCIPVDECPDLPGCDALATEAECVARPDCDPYYTGIGCDCDPATDVCTCDEWVYESCGPGGTDQ